LFCVLCTQCCLCSVSCVPNVVFVLCLVYPMHRTQTTLGTQDTEQRQHWVHKTQNKDNIEYTRHRTKTTLGTQDTEQRQHWVHKTQNKDNIGYSRIYCVLTWQNTVNSGDVLCKIEK
jgi:hypothetical protein